MKSYYAELDDIEDCRTAYYPECNDKELTMWVEDDLAWLGGGHADNYDEDREIYKEIEV